VSRAAMIASASTSSTFGQEESVSPGKHSMTGAAKEAVSEQFDLFLPYLADLPLRDQREMMMERPFFSLAKSKRVKPIDHRSPAGKLWVHVSASPHYGMARIWDADILIYCASVLAEGMTFKSAVLT
jgi:plasmid replication initiation protein